MTRVGISESSASMSVLLFGGIVILLLFAKVILIPLAFALTLSFLLVPAVSRLESWVSSESSRWRSSAC